MGKFLGSYNLPILNQNNSKYRSTLTSIKEIEMIIITKTFPKLITIKTVPKIKPNPDGFTS